MSLLFFYHGVITHMQALLLQGEARFLLILFIVHTLGEFGIPFPFVSQGLLFLSGYELSQGTFHAIPLILVLLLSRQVGAMIVYRGAQLFGDAFIEWLGRYLRPIKKDALAMVREKLGEKAIGAITIGRLTPGFLVPTSLAAGVLKIPYRYFALGIVFSGVVWDGIFMIIGVLGHYRFR